MAELLLSCGLGDAAALRRLFDILYPLISRVGSEDDVVAAFVRLWQQAPRYDGQESAVAWVMRVTELWPSSAKFEHDQPGSAPPAP